MSDLSIETSPGLTIGPRKFRLLLRSTPPLENDLAFCYVRSHRGAISDYVISNTQVRQIQETSESASVTHFKQSDSAYCTASSSLRYDQIRRTGSSQLGLSIYYLYLYLYPIYSKFTDSITFSRRAIPPLRASAADIRSSTDTTDPKTVREESSTVEKEHVMLRHTGKYMRQELDIYTRAGYGFGIGGPERSSAQWIHVRCHDLPVGCT